MVCAADGPRHRLPGRTSRCGRPALPDGRNVAGSDAGIGPIKPHDVVRYAPAQLRDIGIGQAEALRMITSGAAGVIGLGHRKGRIAPGFDADILAIDGNPLEDLAAIRRLRAVYAGGRPVIPAPGSPAGIEVP